MLYFLPSKINENSSSKLDPKIKKKSFLCKKIFLKFSSRLVLHGKSAEM